MERSKDNLAQSHSALGVEPGTGPWFRGGWHWVCWRGLLDATSHRGGGRLWSSSNTAWETSGASRWLCCCKCWCCLDAGWSNENFSWCQPQMSWECWVNVVSHTREWCSHWVGKEALPLYQTLTVYPCGAPEDQPHAFWKSRMEAMKGIAVLTLILAF